jgi:hypothetical protein
MQVESIEFSNGFITTSGGYNIVIPDTSGQFALISDLFSIVSISGSSLLLTKKLILSPSTSAAASVNIPTGTDPVSAAEGDVWKNSGGLVVKNNNFIRQVGVGTSTVGAMSKAVITDNGDGTVNVGGVDVFIYSQDNWDGDYLSFHIPSASNLLLTDLSINYLIYNYGDPSYSLTTDETIINNSNVVLISKISREGTTLHWASVDWGAATAVKDNLRNATDGTSINSKFIKTTGLSLSEGTAATFVATSGKVWYGTSEYDLSDSTSISGVEFYYHVDGSWTKSTETTYNNTQYDDGANLITISDGKYVINWIYRHLDENNKKLAYVLGGGDYAIEEAITSAPPDIPTYLEETSILIGKIIVKKNDAIATQVYPQFDPEFLQNYFSVHNNMFELQGGTSGEYYHLTDFEYDNLIGATEVAGISSTLFSYVASTSGLANGAYIAALNSASTGVITGGVLTVSSSSSCHIAGGTGIIFDHTTGFLSAPTFYFFGWGDMEVSLLSYITGAPFVYIAVDRNSNPIVKTDPFTPQERRDNVQIGKVIFRGNAVTSAVTIQGENLDVGAQVWDLADAIGSLNLTGNVFGPSGANLSLHKTAGTSFRYSVNKTNNIKEPSLTNDAAQELVSFYRCYRNAAGSDFTYIKNQTQIDPDYYDDGSGTLSAVPSGKFTIQRIYFGPYTENTYIPYGQAVYDTQSEAKFSISSENFVIPDDVFEGLTLRGWIIIQSGTIDLTNSLDAVFIPSGKFGTVGGGGSPTSISNHNDLTGLQGGTGGQYYHLTQAAFNDYIGASQVAAISGALMADDALRALDSTVVHLTGAEIITGLKTFTASPIIAPDTVALSGSFQDIVTRITTTNNSFTTTLIGGTTAISVPTNSTFTFNSIITAKNTNTGVSESGGFIMSGVIQNVNGTVSLQGTAIITVIARANNAWSVQAVANNTSKTLDIQVRGENGKTIKWVTKTTIVQVGI